MPIVFTQDRIPKTAVCLFLGILLFLSAGAPNAVAQKAFTLSYHKGLLSLQADQAPLVKILRELADKTGIDVMVSPDIQPMDVSIRLAEEPVELALRRLLRGFSYAVVYARTEDAWQVASLKVYPEGRQDGDVVALVAQPAIPAAGETVLRTVLYPSGQESVTYGKLGREGLLIPSRTVPAASAAQAPRDLDKPWFKLQKQLEHQENRQYAELLLRQKKIEAAQDAETREALALSYADEVAKFFATKKANLNKIEALKRIHGANPGGGKN